MTQQISEEIWQEFEREQDRIKDFDISKLKLTPENNNALNEFFSKFLDPKEEFPEGSRHSIIEKNFAIYIVTNKIDLEKIKEAYKAKGFNIQSLLSQIQGVVSGTYGEDKEPNVFIGELVNWCKEFRPDLVEIFKNISGLDETKILRRDDLKFQTNHIQTFELIDCLSQIVGEEYIHLKKLLHYHILSGFIPQHLLTCKRGQIEIDLRDYLFLVYATGSAKGNVKNLINNIKRDLNHDSIILTSFHEEQLIGRVVNRGTKRKPDYIKNYGHFKAKEIIIDECKPLLTERDKETSRNFLLIGMDKFQQNEIFKRLTENLDNPEEILRYFPDFNALFGTQPFKFDEEKIVLNGFLKRVTTDYVPPKDRPDDYFDKRLQDKRDLTSYKNKLYDYLKKIEKIKNNPDWIKNNQTWTFSEDFDSTFSECYKLLRHAGSYNTRKKRNYTRLVEWQLQDRLLRKSCLVAMGTDLTTCVNKKHLELAFMDLLEDFIIELEFVNDKVYGDLDYGSVWGTTNKKEKQLLNLLFGSGATSEEKSSVTIADFQEKIRDIFKVGIDQARKIYYKMIENNLINSKRVDKHGSKVWLINPPEKTTSDTSGTSGNEVKRKYFDLVIKYSKSDTSGNAL